MKRRDFIKNSLCIGCVEALGIEKAFSIPATFTPEEELEMQKFIYKSVDELPRKIRLDICNLCQLNCAACWVRASEKQIKETGGGFGYVSFKRFKKFIDDNPYINDIEVSNHGEIFLNPDFDKIIEYAYKKNIILTAHNGVNMNTLSEKTAENLVKYQFRHLTVSIDGATPETYAIYRRGGNFNTVINNIKTINKYKKLYDSIFPILAYKFIVFGHNEHEIEQAIKLAQELNMEIIFETNGVPFYDSPIKDIKKVEQLTGIINAEELFKMFFNNYRLGKDDWYLCTDLFNRPIIDYNGDLFGCCINMLDNFKVNVFKQGFLNALNDKRVLYAKLILTNFKFKPKKDYIPCNNCFVYNNLKTNNYPIQIDRLE